MGVSDADVLSFAVGGIAVVFSGFVLSYSVAGGLAVVAGGALALALPFLRGDGSRAIGALAWLVVAALLAAGVGGFLVGFGVFDDPDVTWESEATLHDADSERPAVVVTGEVTNAGDATADDVVVTATLLDAEDEEIRSESTRLAPLHPATTQLFFLRFEGGDEMRRFADAEVWVDASE